MIILRHEMCAKAVRHGPYLFQEIPDHFKTQEISAEAFDPDKPMTLCEKAVKIKR